MIELICLGVAVVAVAACVWLLRAFKDCERDVREEYDEREAYLRELHAEQITDLLNRLMSSGPINYMEATFERDRMRHERKITEIKERAHTDRTVMPNGSDEKPERDSFIGLNAQV